jgi:putative glycosyltransferase
MDLSIVTTLYRSSPYLREFHRRVSAAAAELGGSYEIVLVNDGSPDDSLEVALELRRCDPLICIVDLSRNFGQHKAMMTGLKHARGKRVFLLDCDLEEDPELLMEFAHVMDEAGADVVFGLQRSRKGGIRERVSGGLFYRLLNMLTAQRITPNQLCARLMTRRYVHALTEHRDREVFLQGLWAITGFTQVAVPVTKHSKGTSAYTLSRKITMTVDAITSFSNRPLELVFYLGAVILAVSLLGASFLVFRRLFMGHLLPGWASTMVVISFMGGLNIFCVGLVGVYVAKVFSETKDRPYTIVRQLYPSGGEIDLTARSCGAGARDPR